MSLLTSLIAVGIPPPGSGLPTLDAGRRPAFSIPLAPAGEETDRADRRRAAP